MTMLEDLRADLVRDEGWIPHAYLDSEGLITVGVGFMIDKKRGGKLYDEEINFILDNRMRMVSRELGERLPQYRLYPEIVRRAVLNMAYNLGVSGLLRFKRMIAALDAGDYQTAATEALNSKWASQVGPRAHRIAALIREG